MGNGWNGNVAPLHVPLFRPFQVLHVLIPASWDTLPAICPGDCSSAVPPGRPVGYCIRTSDPSPAGLAHHSSRFSLRLLCQNVNSGRHFLVTLAERRFGSQRTFIGDSVICRPAVGAVPPRMGLTDAGSSGPVLDCIPQRQRGARGDGVSYSGGSAFRKEDWVLLS